METAGFRENMGKKAVPEGTASLTGRKFVCVAEEFDVADKNNYGRQWLTLYATGE